MNRRRYISPAKARGDRRGLALIAFSLCAFAGLIWGAYEADKANGISVSESLASAGIGRAAARPVRLLGECNGRILGAMEESDFPAGCVWIEPVRLEPGQ